VRIKHKASILLLLLFIFTFDDPLMSSFFSTEFFPPKTIARRGWCQFQVLFCPPPTNVSPLMPNLKTQFFDKIGFVRSILIPALIAIGYYSLKHTKQLNTLAIQTFASIIFIGIPSLL